MVSKNFLLDRLLGLNAERVRRMHADDKLRQDGPWIMRDSISVLGITQREMAGRLGITNVHVCNITTGKARLTLDMASRLAEIMSAEISE